MREVEDSPNRCPRCQRVQLSAQICEKCERPPLMFVQGYDGNDYTSHELMKGIHWLLDEYNSRDPGDGTYWEQYKIVHT